MTLGGVLALLSWSSAAPPSPARLCAEAAEGTEVDVCLKLAASHPEAADTISTALRAHIDRAGSADRELMNALLLLHGEHTAIRGAEHMRHLNDPRVIPPLVHAVRTRSEPVAIAAIDAVAAYPIGLPYLTAWLLDKEQPLMVRRQCAKALGRLQRAEAADALIDSLRRRGLPPKLRTAIESEIRNNHPNRVDELVHRISQDGTPWLTLSGGLSLGYLLAVAGRFSQPKVAGMGALTGTIAGGTVGYLTGQALPTEAGDAAFIAVNGVVGTAGGLALGAGLSGRDPNTASYVGVGGELLGLTSGVVLASAHRGTPSDSLKAAAIGVAFAGIAGGAMDLSTRNGLLAPNSRIDLPLVGVGAGLLAGTAFGHVIAPKVRLQGNDWALIVLTTATGAGIGTFAPLLGNERGLLPVLGASAGALTGFALAGSIDPSWDELGSGALGGVFGGLMVGGAIHWIRPDEQDIIGTGVVLGGLAGMAAGGFIAGLDNEPIDDRDVILASYITAWTAGQVLAANTLTSGDPLGSTGPLLVLPAVSGAIVAGLRPIIDVPVTHSSAALTLGLLGAYTGGTIGQIAFKDPVTAGLIGGNGGILIGAVLLSPLVGTPPTVIAFADAGAVLGGASGLAVARGFNRDSDVLLLGTVVGSGVGFASGAITGHLLRKSGITRNIALHTPRIRLPEELQIAMIPAAFPTTQDTAWGVTLQVSQW